MRHRPAILSSASCPAWPLGTRPAESVCFRSRLMHGWRGKPRRVTGIKIPCPTCRKVAERRPYGGRASLTELLWQVLNVTDVTALQCNRSSSHSTWWLSIWRLEALDNRGSSTRKRFRTKLSRMKCLSPFAPGFLWAPAQLCWRSPLVQLCSRFSCWYFSSANLSERWNR